MWRWGKIEFETEKSWRWLGNVIETSGKKMWFELAGTDSSWHSSAVPGYKNRSPLLGSGRAFFKQEICVLPLNRNGRGRNPFLHIMFSSCLQLKITNRPKCHMLGCCVLILITSCPEGMEPQLRNAGVSFSRLEVLNIFRGPWDWADVFLQRFCYYFEKMFSCYVS